MLCFGTNRSCSIWAVEAPDVDQPPQSPLYFRRFSSVYHISTSWAFLFNPSAAIPRARLPPVTLASAEIKHVRHRIISLTEDGF